MQRFWPVKIRGRRLANFDIFQLKNSAVIYYFLEFGVLFLAQVLGVPSKIIEYANSKNISILSGESAILLLLGLLSLVVGYELAALAEKFVKMPRIKGTEWRGTRIAWILGGVFISGLLIKILRIVSGAYFHSEQNPVFVNSDWYSLIGFLDWLGPISLAVAFAYYFFLFKTGNPDYRIWQRVAWLIFAVEFFYGLFSGNHLWAIVPIVIYFIVRGYVWKVNYKAMIILIIFILFLLMPFQNFYRNSQNLTSYSIVGNYPSISKVLGLQQFIFDSSFGRINQSVIVSGIFDKTSRFLYGRDLLGFFISFGPPRFIWKDKPVINSGGNELGRRIGVLAAGDRTTSVGPTIVGDWYINFGLAGIVLGMMFMGFVFRFLYDFLIDKNQISLSGVMIYSILWIQIIKGSEDWIAPVWAGLVKIFIILLIIHLLLTGRADKI